MCACIHFFLFWSFPKSLFVSKFDFCSNGLECLQCFFCASLYSIFQSNQVSLSNWLMQRFHVQKQLSNTIQTRCKKSNIVNITTIYNTRMIRRANLKKPMISDQTHTHTRIPEQYPKKKEEWFQQHTFFPRKRVRERERGSQVLNCCWMI